MAEKSSSASHRDTVARIRAADSFAVNLPILGRVRVPRPEQVAYFGALGALAAFEIIEWPIALAIAAGHALAQNQRSRVAQEIGEALEDA
jgi:xanthosine utilization system XapX-like protein